MRGALVLGLATAGISASSSNLALAGPGVLVAPGADTEGADPRLGRLAGGFARAGLESFVAGDMVRPPPGADRAIVRGRRRTEDARRLRQLGRLAAAAETAHEAVDMLEANVSDAEHVRHLVNAYVERGAAAVGLDDPITAETLFLRAVALSPRHRLASRRFRRRTRRLFAEVRRASRLLRYGTVRVTAPGLDHAEVSVDFGPARVPPYETQLPDGRHFVSVRAPGRVEVVAAVSVRAERRTALALRPPTRGDAEARRAAVSAYDPERSSTVVALAKAADLPFVAVATAADGVFRIELRNGSTAIPTPNGAVTLSADPAPAEIDAAVTKLVQSALLVAPDLLMTEDEPGWYATWWGITLIGVAVSAAATTTAILLTRDGETEYRFVP